MLQAQLRKRQLDKHLILIERKRMLFSGLQLLLLLLPPRQLPRPFCCPPVLPLERRPPEHRPPEHRLRGEKRQELTTLLHQQTEGKKGEKEEESLVVAMVVVEIAGGGEGRRTMTKKKEKKYQDLMHRQHLILGPLDSLHPIYISSMSTLQHH